MAKPPTKPAKKPADQAETPDVERHDEVFFRHPSGPRVGKVLARGEHGCTVDHGGKRHQVKWENFLGHKTRVRPDVKVVEHGEDGFLVEAPDKSRRFVRDPTGLVEAVEPLAKAEPVLILFGARPDVMVKAIANAPGLSLRDVTDKGGHRTKRWMKTTKDGPKPRHSHANGGGPGGGKPAPADSGSAAGFGTHNLDKGDKIGFKAGDFEGTGHIVSHGKDGAHVKDGSGRHHQVLWSEVTGHHKPKVEGAKEAAATTPAGRDKHASVEPGKFNATAYAKAHDDAGVTPESIISQFPPDTVGKIRAVQDRLGAVEETIAMHKSDDGEYKRERQALHRQILFSGMTKKVMDEDTGEMVEKHFPGLLSPERVEAATPKDGQAPTFTILGGRGGSGKSWFKDKVYDEASSIVLDADHIKQLLPEYEGWNAHQVHEESGELFDLVTTMARSLGLNLVHDATMKTANKAIDTVKTFKDAGYRIEAHYMHLPRQEAAKRAVHRFLGKTERYVPVTVVLSNTSNEASFDEVRQHADAWSFRDNNVPRGQDPVLISQGGGKKDA